MFNLKDKVVLVVGGRGYLGSCNLILNGGVVWLFLED